MRHLNLINLNISDNVEDRSVSIKKYFFKPTYTEAHLCISHHIFFVFVRSVGMCIYFSYIKKSNNGWNIYNLLKQNTLN